MLCSSEVAVRIKRDNTYEMFIIGSLPILAISPIKLVKP